MERCPIPLTNKCKLKQNKDIGNSLIVYSLGKNVGKKALSTLAVGVHIVITSLEGNLIVSIKTKNVYVFQLRNLILRNLFHR